MIPVDSDLCLKIFELLPDAILLAEDGAVLAANPAASTLFAAHHGTLAAHCLDDLIHPDYRATFQERMSYMRRTGRPTSMVAERIVRLDGEMRDVVTSSAPLDGEGSLVVLLMRDVSEHRKVEAALALTAEQLRALTAHQGTLIEEERKRMAREIHDELGQQLTFAKLRLAALRVKDPETISLRDEVAAALDSSIRTVRRLATELRPALLDSVGLTAAVEWQSRAFEQRYGIRVDAGRVEAMNVHPDVATALFRILQEALTNIARHSQATQAHVSLFRDGVNVVLKIADNGRGMPEGRDLRQSLGILGMRERAGLLGGSLAIDTAPAAGTRLTIEIPLQPLAAADQT